MAGHCCGAQVEPNGKLKLSRKAVLLADLAAGFKSHNGDAHLPVIGDVVRCACSPLAPLACWPAGTCNAVEVVPCIMRPCI
jgi:hypothetical protein